MTGALLAGISLWQQRRTGAHLALLVAMALCGAGLARWNASTEIPSEVSDGPVRVEGVVEDVLPLLEGGRIELAVSRVAGSPDPARFRAFLYARDPLPPLHPGQRLLVETRLRPQLPPANPGQPDHLGARWRRGLVLSGSFDPGRMVVLSGPAGWRRWLAREHGRLRELAVRLSPSADAAALYLTLAAGLRASLSADVEEAFAQSGLAHVLSVSGLHVAALALFALRLMRFAAVRLMRRRRWTDPRRPAALFAIPLVWAYVAFTGWQPPAVRSAVMATVVLLGMALRRRGDALNSLGLAALVLVAVDPAACASLSLQLSFLAILALVLVAPAVRELVPIPPPDPHAPRRLPYPAQKAAEALLQIFCASVAVVLTTLPLTASVFHRVSVAGLVANVVALPLSGALTALAAAGAALSVVAPPSAAPVIWAGGWLSEALLWLARGFGAAPGATADLPSFPAWALALFLAGVFGFAIARGPWRWLGAAAPAAFGAVVLPVALVAPGLEVTFLSVGHGDAVVLSSLGQHALVDGGGVPGGADTGRRTVLPFLRERGVRDLSYAVLSHPHADHALGLASVVEQVPTRRVWLPPGTGQRGLGYRVALAGESTGARVEEVRAGRPPARLGEAWLEVLGPPEDDALLEGENDRSVVVRVRHGHVTFLLPGDVEAAGEEPLDPGPVTVLKAAHHGSATSSTPAFVGRVRPRHVVFCVGVNSRFGFPDDEVVGRFEAAGARCHRTDLHGAVTFRSDGQSVAVERWWDDGRPDERPLPRTASVPILSGP